MAFNSGDHFTVDPSESQIAEGLDSVYGQANSHFNCVPATATQMIMAAGGPDIDPQLVENMVYGASHRGGSEWSPIIAFLESAVPGFKFNYYPYFNFDIAEQAGDAGLLVGISGWCDNGPFYNPVGEKNGLSHASILWAHNPDDSFVIWNIWRGKFETYSRALLAASLYEMAVLTSTPTGGGFMAGLNDQQQTDLANQVYDIHKWLAELRNIPDHNGEFSDGTKAYDSAQLDRLTFQLTPNAQGQLTAGGVADLISKIHSAVGAIGGTVDLAAVTALLNDIKGAVATDADTHAKVIELEKHLGVGTP